MSSISDYTQLWAMRPDENTARRINYLYFLTQGQVTDGKPLTLDFDRSPKLDPKDLVLLRFEQTQVVGVVTSVALTDIIRVTIEKRAIAQFMTPTLTVDQKTMAKDLDVEVTEPPALDEITAADAIREAIAGKPNHASLNPSAKKAVEQLGKLTEILADAKLLGPDSPISTGIYNLSHALNGYIADQDRRTTALHKLVTELDRRTKSTDTALSQLDKSSKDHANLTYNKLQKKVDELSTKVKEIEENYVPDLEAELHPGEG